MVSRPLEEAYLVGMFLSQVAWGRLAGLSAAELRRAADCAMMFHTLLGCTRDLAPALEPQLHGAGPPRQRTTPEMLHELHGFYETVVGPLLPGLHPQKAAAVRLGFHLTLALAAAQLGTESPQSIRPLLLDILSTLRDVSLTLPVFREPLDRLYSVGEAARDREQFLDLHARVRAMLDRALAELRGLQDGLT